MQTIVAERRENLNGARPGSRARSPLLKMRMLPSPDSLWESTEHCAGRTIVVSRRAIRRRIAPPIQEIAAVAATSTQVAGRFLTGRAVIDHPNFTVIAHRHDDLVKVCVVGDGIGVCPVRIWSGRVVRIDQTG